MTSDEPFGVNELIGLWTRAGFTHSQMLDLLAGYFDGLRVEILWTESEGVLWLKCGTNTLMDDAHRWPSRK